MKIHLAPLLVVILGRRLPACGATGRLAWLQSEQARYLRSTLRLKITLLRYP